MSYTPDENINKPNTNNGKSFKKVSSVTAAAVAASLAISGLTVVSAPVAATAATAPTVATVAPSALMAGQGNAQFTATWKAPAVTFTAYKLQYSTDATFATGVNTVDITAKDANGAVVTSATVSGLANGTTYYVRVAAVNTATVGKFTGGVKVVTYGTPTAPTGGKATLANKSSVVTWSAPSATGGTPITGYTLEYSTDATFATGVTTVTTVAATKTATITGLDINTTYYYRVKANNIIGSSTASTVFSAKTFALPDAPITVAAAKSNANGVVTWVAPVANGGSAITGYILQYATNPEFTGATEVALGNIKKYTIPTLTPSTTYYARVKAVTVVGSGSWSTPTASVTSYDLPSVPTTVSATGGVNTVKVVWAAPSANGGMPITGYKVESSTDSTFATGVTSTIVSATTLSQTIKTTPNSKIYFRISAKTLIGWSSPATVNATSFNTPSSVETVTVTPAIGKMTVNWTAPTNNGGSAVTGYRVEYSTSSDFAGSKSFNASALLPSATISSLLPGTKYYVRVYAKSLVGEGTASTTTEATTPSAPSVPTSVTGSSTTAGSAVSMNIAWSTPTSAGDYPITGYSIRYSTDPTFATGVKTVSATSSARSTLIKSLAANTVYYVKVAAVSLAGQSMSASLQVDTTVATAPSQVATPTATLNGSNIDVAWTAPAANGSAITGYLVEYADNVDFTGATSANVTETTTTLTGLTAGSTYYVRVKAVNAVGASVASTSASATVPVVADGKVTAESLINGKSVSWMAFYGASTVWTVDTPYLVVDAYGYYYTSQGSGWLNVLTTPEQLLAAGWSTTDNATFTDNWGNIFYLDVHGNSIKLNPSYAANASYAYAVDANGKAYALELPAAATTPTSPRDVTAVGKDNAITVTFKAPSSDGLSAVSTYTVEYSKDATFTTGVQTLTVAAGFNTTLELTGLDYQQKYYIKVTAVGTTGSSTPVTVEASATDGTFNTGVTASALTVNAVEGSSSWLYYSPTWNETFKMLRVYSNGNQSPTVGYIYISRFQSENVWGLAGDTKAEIIASAVNQYGFTQSTNANGETILTKTEVWDWDTSNGGLETGIVFKNDGSIYEYTKYLNDTAVSHDSTTYLQKANGAIYTFGAPSENFVAPVAPTVPVPAAPKNVVVESLFDNANLRIRWDNWGTSVQPITGYRVEYSTNADFSNAVVVNTANTSYMFDSPQLGKTYYVKVYAISSAGTSVAGTGSLTMPADPRPSAPIVTTTGVTDSAATVNWTVPTEHADAVQGYIVQWSKSINFTDASSYGYVQGTSYTINDLDPSARYYVRVLVANSIGSQVISDSATADTQPLDTSPVVFSKPVITAVGGNDGWGERALYIAPTTTTAATTRTKSVTNTFYYRVKGTSDWTAATLGFTSMMSPQGFGVPNGGTQYEVKLVVTDNANPTNNIESDIIDVTTPLVNLNAWVNTSSSTVETSTITEAKVSFNLQNYTNTGTPVGYKIVATNTATNAVTEYTPTVTYPNFMMGQIDVHLEASVPFSSGNYTFAVKIFEVSNTNNEKVLDGTISSGMNAPLNVQGASFNSVNYLYFDVLPNVVRHEVEYQNPDWSTSWNSQGTIPTDSYISQQQWQDKQYINYQVSGLSSYKFRVRAVFADGSTTAWSVPVSQSDITNNNVNNWTIADQITSVTTSNIGIDGLDVSWAAPATHGYPITEYVVTYDTVAPYSWGWNWTAKTVTVSGTSTHISGLVDGTDYYVSVKAVTRAGDSDNGRNITATTFTTPVDTSPVFLSTPVITASAGNDGWGERAVYVAPAVSQKATTRENKVTSTFYYRIKGTSDWTAATLGFTSMMAPQGFGADAGTTYEVKLTTTVNADPTNTVDSNIVEVTTPAANLNGSLNGTGTVSSVDATTAKVDLLVVNYTGGTTVNYKIVATNNTNSEVTEITPDVNRTVMMGTKYDYLSFNTPFASTGYTFEVIGTDANNVSNTKSFGSTTLNLTAPPTVVLASVSDGANLEVRASAVANATSYEIAYEDNAWWGGKTESVSIMFSSVDGPYYLFGASDYSTSYFKVRAVFADGTKTAWSSTVLATAPATPTSVTANLSGADINVSWSAPANNGSQITGYTVEYADNADFTNALSVESAGTSTTLTGLIAGSTYYVRVKANNVLGSSAWTQSASCITKAPVVISGSPWFGTNNQMYMAQVGALSVSSGSLEYSYEYSMNNGVTYTTINKYSDYLGHNLVEKTWLTMADVNGTSIVNYSGYLSIAKQNIPYGATNVRFVARSTADNSVSYVKESSFVYPGEVPVSLAAGESYQISSTQTTVTLGWEARNNVTGWKVYKDGILVGSTSDPLASSITLTGLNANTSYQFSVVAVNGAGESQQYNSVTATTLDWYYIDAMPMYYVSDAGNVWTGAHSATWTAETPVLVYAANADANGNRAYTYATIYGAKAAAQYYASGGKGAVPYDVNADGSVTSHQGGWDVIMRNYTADPQSGGTLVPLFPV